MYETSDVESRERYTIYSNCFKEVLREYHFFILSPCSLSVSLSLSLSLSLIIFSISICTQVSQLFYEIPKSVADGTLPKCLRRYERQITRYEIELSKRGKYFGGEKTKTANRIECIVK